MGRKSAQLVQRRLERGASAALAIVIVDAVASERGEERPHVHVGSHSKPKRARLHSITRSSSLRWMS